MTVITRSRHMNSPEIQEFRANGAEIWSDVMIRASYEGVKKARPDAPYLNMRDMFGKHKGETVFVCGAGPGLNDAPNKLPGPTFAINRAIRHVEADYWCFSDMKALRDNGDHPNAKKATLAFSSAMHVFLKDIPGYLIEANGSPLGHSIEAQRPLYWNGATFSWALHWAIKSGAKRVITVGCDFSLGGYFDGTEIVSTKQMGSRIVSEIARLRVEDMFGPDKAQWFDADVELLDASKDGYLPIKKTRLEGWL